MARPLKNNCEYFSHDNNMRNHRKIKALRQNFVNGYAFWNMFLEFLTGADGNVFENSDIEKEMLSGDFGITITEITDIINFCCRIELLFEKEGFIFSKSLNERLKPVYDKRGKAKELSEKQKRLKMNFCNSNTERTVISVTETPITVTEIPQSKVKEIKVEETKINKSKKEKDIAKNEKVFAYTKCISIYDDFCLQRLTVSAKIDGAEGNAMKAIISYLKKVVKTQPPTEEDVINAFEFILNKYDCWDKFRQGQMKLAQISSNLINIINDIKNGNKTITGTEWANSFNELRAKGYL